MTLSKRILTAVLSGTLLISGLNLAEAGPRHGWNDGPRHGWDHNPRPPRYDHHRRHNNNAGAAVAAGVIGLAAGAILLGSMNQQSRAAPAPSYYPPAPYPGSVSSGLQPWSPAWYQYCESRYRSFNPSTGTFTTYQGEQRFCQ
ncbi:BA14K family protein [Roseibium litorale]|uniref:Lectin-like protein BA14k n=1 Tax=Roseibium litorale TaxID=2803841 RepID=A0ABR9CIE7_9HYPH|nr:BA14K family protein [Roseibium litorale]MBD8890602.1 BA14K family protein [Roseibium litorale]